MKHFQQQKASFFVFKKVNLIKLKLKKNNINLVPGNHKLLGHTYLSTKSTKKTQTPVAGSPARQNQVYDLSEFMDRHPGFGAEKRR